MNGEARSSSILLDRPTDMQLVVCGPVEIYATAVAAGLPVGRRIHLYSAESGTALFGSEPDGYGLLAVAAPGAVLESWPDIGGRWRQYLEQKGRLPAAAVLYLIEGWAIALFEAAAHSAPPRQFAEISAGAELSLPDGHVIRPAAEVLWLELIAGEAVIGDSDFRLTPEDGRFPVTSKTWLTVKGDSRLRSYTENALSEWLEAEKTVAAAKSLKALGRLAGRIAAVRIASRKAAEDRQNLEKRKRKQRIEQLAGHSLARFDEDQTLLEGFARESPLLAVCRLVADHQGMDGDSIQSPLPYPESAADLNRIAAACGLRIRKVLLRENWWREDGGPFIGFTADKRPVALLPTSPGQYLAYDPTADKPWLLTEETAKRIEPFAHMFYRTFPAHALGIRDLIQFAGRSFWRRDLSVLLLLGILGGLLGMLGPIATGLLFGDIIPTGDYDQLITLVTVLATASLAGLAFQFVRGVALIRLEGRLNSEVEAALWDRLLNLPLPFFRQFTAGDLAVRAGGINTIRAVLTGAVFNTMFSSVFSVFQLALMLYFSWRLTLLSIGLLLLYVSVSLGIGAFAVRYRREAAERQGKLAGLVLQILGAIAKFRIAQAESQAYFLWAREYGKQRRSAFLARMMENRSAVLNSAAVLLINMAIFYWTDIWQNGKLSNSEFLAFYAAFGVFSAALFSLSSTAMSILQIVPAYERMLPILRTAAETEASAAEPGELTGRIEVASINFRYLEDGPEVLKEVSFTINPGEFVAVVGVSGSGKSTMLRILLGFEKPGSGSVYYDGQNMGGLNKRSVRCQIGTVLQNGRLISGDIFSNIVGSLPLSIDDAWEAARQVGIAEDIQQMPMGMHTLIGEGSSSISGGQRQRILIARAIVNRPRIVFMDEATSALDNRTQAVVIDSLRRLKATRLVIAHRLSTVKEADRILVMSEGRIVETGTYQELLQKKGQFAELAKRQLWNER